MLDLLHFRVDLGFPTFFVKVRAHRGEPYNEAPDRIASMATHDEDVPLLWNAPSGRIIYQFTPDPSDSEDTLYTASMNNTVKKFIKNQVVMSNLYSSHSPGVTESVLRRPHSSRDLQCVCLSTSSFSEKAKKRLMQQCKSFVEMCIVSCLSAAPAYVCGRVGLPSSSFALPS